MQSLKELYKVGRGPSSSHTMGPERAARWMQKQYPDAERFEVVLYGSLASTGKGHNTDLILTQTFAPTPCKVLFDTQTPCPVHPNTMDITAFTPSGKVTRRVYSVGGGTITIEGVPKKTSRRSVSPEYLRRHCRLLPQ
jgi:L-serine dehydratase